MVGVSLLVGSLALPALTVPVASAGTPPNVLVLVADDLGVDALSAYGEGTSLPSTPNIDALAQGGLLFRNAWSNPVCSSTRAGLLTGRYSFRQGIGWLVYEAAPGPPLPLSELTLPEALDLTTGGQYAHAAFGKWHLGDSTVGGDLAPNLAGFSHFAGTLANLFAPEDYFNFTKITDGVSTAVTSYATSETVDDVLAWVGQTPDPWFAYVGFHAPHTPYHSPPASLHSVDLTQPTKRKQFEAMVEALDTEIGRLLNGLAPAVRANTTVIFVGDNGSHGQITLPPFDPKHAKGTLYEGGVNVPLIVQGQLVTELGQEVTGLVSTTDLFATVLQIAGGGTPLPKGAGRDSIGLRPYFTNAQLPPLRNYAYAEAFLPNGPKQRPPWFPIGGGGGSFVCQEDLGFGGPGTASMTICGEPLYSGYLDSDQHAQLLVMSSLPDNAGMLFSSFTSNPMPMFGGTIVPNPALIEPFQTDANGGFTKVVMADQHTLGPRYYQAAVRDLSLPGGFAITNCIAAETLPADLETIRDQRFKLIVDNNLGREEFYDLGIDPFEQDDLLASGRLTKGKLQRYVQLRAQLVQLRWDPLD